MSNCRLGLDWKLDLIHYIIYEIFCLNFLHQLLPGDDSNNVVARSYHLGDCPVTNSSYRALNHYATACSHQIFHNSTYFWVGVNDCRAQRG
jgi:hypothetical protein